MFTFQHDTRKTGLEDSPLVKNALSGCPSPQSNQGGYPLDHYEVLKAPGLHLLAAILIVLGQYLLLLHLFVPVVKLQPAFAPGLVVVGVAGAALCQVGSGKKRRTRTKVKTLPAAEAAAEWTNFPKSIRLANAVGMIVLAVSLFYELYAWIYGAGCMNLRSTVIPPTVIAGVSLAWVAIAVGHKRWTGPALWILAATLLRTLEIHRNRRHQPLNSAPNYVHGWRQTKLTTRVEMGFAFARDQYLIPQDREGDDFVSHLYTIGNFNGDHVAELCHDEINGEQKAALAKVLEQVLVNDLDQPSKGADGAITREQVMEEVAKHAAKSNANSAAISRAQTGGAAARSSILPFETKRPA